jgi:hypothetical protein
VGKRIGHFATRYLNCSKSEIFLDKFTVPANRLDDLFFFG